jgi:O-antigen ligase
VELAATPVPRRRERRATLHFDPHGVGAWTLGFAPVLYLALRGGGYDLAVRSEVGLAAWWLLLLGVLAGVFALSQIGTLGWVSLGLLTGFVIWTLVAVTWSESAERTIIEVGRLVSYLGMFVLALLVVRRTTIRQLMSGMGVAFGLIGLLAVLSRLYPGAFPQDQAVAYFHSSALRLNYPLNYSNGTGNFLALGLPLLLLLATRARTIVGQALGAASIPVTVLAIVLTASRGAVLTAAVAILVFYLLSPDRLPKLVTGLVTGAGSAILIGALLRRHAVRDGLSTPLAVSQRHQLMALLLLVCIGVGLAQVGIGLAANFAKRPRILQVSRRAATIAALVFAVVVVVVGIAVGLPTKLDHQWNSFKQVDTTGVASGNLYSRFGTVSGSHRYQYWQVAVHAFKSKPLTGIGPGTFGFYWAQHGPIYEFIRNAHSLYLETLAETGLPGFVLLVGFLLVVLVAGIARSLRAPPLARASLAAGTASFAGFCVGAGYDWLWQLAVIPVAALLLAAAILAFNRERPRPDAPPTGARKWVPRFVAVGVSAAALVAIAIPYGTNEAISASQAAFRAGNPRAALSDAETAQTLQPYAATPRLQRAVILEALGDLPQARVAIAQALAREPTNFQIWLVASRIQAESGHPHIAVRDYQRAHLLSPRSPLTAE